MITNELLTFIKTSSTIYLETKRTLKKSKLLGTSVTDLLGNPPPSTNGGIYYWILLADNH